MTVNPKPGREQTKTPSKVKGPIRCHKCQLNCRDADHYLSHECKPNASPECNAFPSLASLNRK